ncbi:MAG TPA: zinc ribbon domain-containing protein [Clostridia bacterium]|nr:zinc ribbon domain-containing protein [Clostridia bacterium]
MSNDKNTGVKVCISCGMPMMSPSDYPLMDESKDYCKYCARPDGCMQSYPEKLEGTAEFLVITQGLDSDAANKMAVRILSKLPAWKDI